MEHLDEGTIHAWLDGALPPDESARIERHVATCESCAAAVAEARGLIAASSRILSALDDVPKVLDSEVVRIPAVPLGREATRVEGDATNHSGARRARRPRQWFMPRYAAAAGIAAIAFASLLVARNREAVMASRPQEDAASAVRGPESSKEAVGAATPAPAPVAAPAAPVAAPDTRTAARNEAAEAPARRGVVAPPLLSQPAARSPRAFAEPEASRVADAATRATAANADRPAVAPSQVAPAPEPPRAINDSAARSLARETREQAVAQKSATRDVVASSDSAASGGATPRLAPALRADEIARSERKRIVGEPMRMDAVVATGASAAAKSLAATSPVATFVGCWKVVRSSVARDAGLPERVELSATRVEPSNAASPWRAFALGSRTAGDDWRWLPNGLLNGRTAFVLFHGPDVSAPRYLVVTEGEPPSAAVSSATREECRR